MDNVHRFYIGANIYFITNLVKESEASNLLNQLKAIGSVKNIKRIRIESE